MEDDVKKRVKKAIKECEISPSAIAKFRDISDRTVLDQINGKSRIGVATLEALLAFRPELSAEWLMRGTGDMILNAATTRQRDENDTAKSADVIELKDQLRRKDREIDGLYDRIEELKRGTAPQTYVATA